MKLSVELIRTDGATQPREAINAEVVSEYAEAMQSGAVFPPVTVFYDGDTYWCADGFHRIDAVKQVGWAEVDADVTQGTRRDAEWYSFGANKTHGLRRAKGDAKRAIEKILNDPEWSKVPQTKIAEHVGVSREYVNRVSRDIDTSCDRSHDSKRTVTRNGTTYTQNTTNIGKSTPSPTIDPDEWEVIDETEWETAEVESDEPTSAEDDTVEDDDDEVEAEFTDEEDFYFQQPFTTTVDEAMNDTNVYLSKVLRDLPTDLEKHEYVNRLLKWARLKSIEYNRAEVTA